MNLLYPRLPKLQAEEIASQRAVLSVEALIELSKNLAHPNVWFAPTGGTEINENRLLELQSIIRETASHYGYPSNLRMKDAGSFDKACAKILYEEMHIQPVEAASVGIWIYLTVILLPDIVRWRFFDANEATSLERFIGSGRGLRRNTFGRLWWRAHLFYLPINQDDPYLLMSALTEDDQIQISERPSLSGNPRMAREVAIGYLSAQRVVRRRGLVLEKRLLLRDTLKRLSRLIPITMFDMLDENESQHVIDSIFHQALNSIISVTESQS